MGGMKGRVQIGEEILNGEDFVRVSPNEIPGEILREIPRDFHEHRVYRYDGRASLDGEPDVYAVAHTNRDGGQQAGTDVFVLNNDADLEIGQSTLASTGRRPV